MKAIVYGRPNCSYCDKSKQLLESMNIEYDYKIVGNDIQVQELNEMIGHPIKTVPQIFLVSEGFSEYVGGYNELIGKLK